MEVVFFTIEQFGLKRPCHLLYMKDGDGVEIVRFEKGLEGPARFSETFKSYIPPFEHFGISVPHDSQASSTLKTKAGNSVRPQEVGFGEAFYRYYFPKMRKHAPENYQWKTLP